MIYLDSAATTLIKPESVARRTAWAVNNLSSPGRGQYKSADMAEKIAYSCREKAAALFNVNEPDNVVFTFNATHGLNMAIYTLAHNSRRAVVSGYEHNAVIRPLKNSKVEIIKAVSTLFDRKETVKAFEKTVRKDTSFAVCTAMSNVFGFIMPIEEIAEICSERGVPLIIDASQAAGALKLDFTGLKAAFMAMPGHKGLLGPQGTGLLLCSQKVIPLMSGGTGGDSKLPAMPEYLPDAGEAGTHNMPGIAGLSAGLDFVAKTGTERILLHEQSLGKACIAGLKEIPGITVFSGDDKNVQGGVVSFLSSTIDCVSMAEKLSDMGISVRAGLHCAPSAHDTAGTMETGTVRASMSVFTKDSEIKAFLRAVRKVVSEASL